MRVDSDVETDAGVRQGPLPCGTSENELPREWRSIWISDLHLGASSCRAPLLLGLLRHIETEHLFLVGDVVHGAGLEDVHTWDPAHGELVRALVDCTRRTEVVYITGRDDRFVRRYAGLALGSLDVREEVVHETADGRELLVTHPSRIEGAERAREGSVRCKFLGRGADLVRAAFRGGLRGVSAQARAAADAERFERQVADEARRRGLDGVVCGHVHRAGIREVNGVLYCNSGDWIESRTALAEDVRGKLALLRLSAAGSPYAAAGAG